MDSDSDSDSYYDIEEVFTREPERDLVSLIYQIFFFVTSMGSKSGKFISLCVQVILRNLISLITLTISLRNSMDFDSDSYYDIEEEVFNLEPEPETKFDSESELISLISQLLFLYDYIEMKAGTSGFISHLSRIISVVRSMDLNSQPKPETEFMSLITQVISVFYSMDFDSQPMPLQKLILYFSPQISLANSKDSNYDLDAVTAIEPELELVSLIYQIFSLVTSMGSKSGKFISLCPQKNLIFSYGEVHLGEEEEGGNKWDCLPWFWYKLRFPGEDSTGFYCRVCKGKKHEEYKKAPIEIKHPLHRKHSLQLVCQSRESYPSRQCYCCAEYLKEFFYYCSACDFAINVACPTLLSIDYPKWHEHTLHLFPRHASSFICNLCALAHASSHIYMCPNCAFVVHLSCLNELPRVIKISRHHHRISFTPFLDHGDLPCGVCRRKINNDYGCYSCIKDGCSYAAHSRCATQRNIWDGKELEGEPEEEMEELLEPFVRISDGIIQHFTHQHHLKLDENTGRDYDENKMCHACITPIYFGNFYSCMECDFILHEECANLSRKIYHPIHSHLLTLRYDHNIGDSYVMERCKACHLLCIAGFFYMCGEEGCDFEIHVQCATVSEPLVHESHIHPLFLTCIPGERQRICSICKDNYYWSNETFNCVEECDFALCFECATLPHKVRYKHDKHILTLSHGKETSTITYWCEVCEGKVDPQQRFYMCDEYCCVILHIECLIVKDLYMKPRSSWFYLGNKVDILPNNHHMTRPICSECTRRCPHKIIFHSSGSISCSLGCLFNLLDRQFIGF